MWMRVKLIWYKLQQFATVGSSHVSLWDGIL